MSPISASASRLRRTAAKLLRVLESVALAQEGLDARTVARLLGISLSTAYDLLHTLEELGYVYKAPRGSRYILGASTYALWSCFVRQGGIAPILRPVLAELAAATQAPAYLAVYHGGEVTVVDCVGRAVDGVPTVPVGAAVPGHALAVGKVLLAHLPRAELVRYVQRHPLQRFTAATITERRALSLELAGVRLYGMAYDRREYSDQLTCIAAPVCDPAGHVVAAIGLGFSLFRLPDEERTLAEAVRGAAERASARLRDALESPARARREAPWPGGPGRRSTMAPAPDAGTAPPRYGAFWGSSNPSSRAALPPKMSAMSSSGRFIW